MKQIKPIFIVFITTLALISFLNICGLRSAFAAVGEAAACHSVSMQKEAFSCHGSTEKADFPIQKMACCFEAIEHQVSSVQPVLFSSALKDLEIVNEVLPSVPEISKEVPLRRLFAPPPFFVSVVLNTTYSLHSPPVR